MGCAIYTTIQGPLKSSIPASELNCPSSLPGQVVTTGGVKKYYHKATGASQLEHPSVEVTLPLPPGWTRQTTSFGAVFYKYKTGSCQVQHPLLGLEYKK